VSRGPDKDGADAKALEDDPGVAQMDAFGRVLPIGAVFGKGRGLARPLARAANPTAIIGDGRVGGRGRPQRSLMKRSL
jgi:hypothetical protein